MFFNKLTADRCRCLLGWLVDLGGGSEIEATVMGWGESLGSAVRLRICWRKLLVAKRLHQKKRKVKKLTLSVF